jgi:hypothetical protein
LEDKILEAKTPNCVDLHDFSASRVGWGFLGSPPTDAHKESDKSHTALLANLLSFWLKTLAVFINFLRFKN